MPEIGAGQFDIVIITDGAGHYLQLPSLTTVQRDALTAVNGMHIYNSTTSQIEVYDNGAWRAQGQIAVNAHTAILNAHIQSPFETLVVGQYLFPLNRSLPGNIVLLQYRLYATLCVMPRNMAFDRVSVEVEVLEGAKDIRLGLYNASAALYPSTLVEDFGTVDTDSAVLKSITLDPVVSIAKGIYFLVAITDATGTAAVVETTARTGVLGGMSAAFDYASPGYLIAAAGAEFAALPDPFPAAAALDNSMPLIGLRLSALE